jgi:hypothetical protein
MHLKTTLKHINYRSGMLIILAKECNTDKMYC